MKTLFALLLLFFLFGSCSDRNKGNSDSKEIAEKENKRQLDDTPIEDDAKFAVEAAEGGMLEVRLANLALTNASSPKVKEFAQTMINDHSKSNEELKSLADSKNIVLPIALGDKKQEQLSDFAEKKGAEFDKAYCNFMVKDHREDIDKFEKQAEKGNDAEIRAWAASKLQVLQHHLTMAESLDEAIAKND